MSIILTRDLQTWFKETHDIDITSTTSINLIANEDVQNAIMLKANSGGIDIISSGNIQV